MTVAAYNQDRQWDVPGYVWPAVLGVSVALHFSALIYGLPILPWKEDDPLPTVETEVIFESGGLPFEDLARVEAETTQPIEPETPLPVQPAVPVETVSSSGSSEVMEAVASEPVLTESPASVPVGVAPVSVLEPTISNNLDIVSAEEIAIVEPEQAAAEPPEQVQVPQSSVVKPTAAPIVAAAPVSEAIVAVTPSAPTTVVGLEVPVSEIEVPSVSGTTSIEKVVTAGETETVVAAVQDSQVLAPLALEPVTADPTANEAVTQAFLPQTQQEFERPESATPETSIPVTPVATAEVEAVMPAEQQIAALQPAETATPEIAPSAPVSSTVPATQPQGEPTEIVPPVAVASIDPLAKVTDYVTSYKFGDCTHMSVLSAGADSAAVTAFGAGIGPFAIFDQRFKADQGFEAKIEVRLVTRKQCALLDALGISEGIEASGLVELDRTVVRSGTPVSGVVQRDLPFERIASAEQSGLDLSGKGPPELYLIDDAGQIHDGREFLLPAPNSQTAGGWRFKVPVTMVATDKSEETALVLAIWNRPADRQPARFGRLSAERVAEILAEPGVYSLTAFKVSR